MNIIKRLAIAGAAAALSLTAAAADISGAGATFPYPIYAKWADAYKKLTGVGLNYQSIGSGGGIKQIKAKTVTFGASDMPLKPDDLKSAGLLQFPMIIGGVVPVVNIKGVGPGAAAPGRRHGGRHLPGRHHQVERPADQAAESEAGAARARRSRRCTARTDRARISCSPIICPSRARSSHSSIGANTSVQWPIGIGAKGNEGVANMTTQTDGAIGYVEYAYAKQNKMSYTLLTNKAGGVVAPSADSFQAAAANADWAKADSLLPDSDRPSGREELADHRRELHSALQAAGRSRTGARGAEILRLGLQGRREPWRPSSTTCPCRPRLIAQVKKTWTTQITSGGHPVWTGK